MSKKKTMNHLRELRDRSRLTLQEVSLLTGYNVSTVSRHESGDRTLSEDAVLKYAALYKVHTYELFDLNIAKEERDNDSE